MNENAKRQRSWIDASVLGTTPVTVTPSEDAVLAPANSLLLGDNDVEPIMRWIAFALVLPGLVACTGPTVQQMREIEDRLSMIELRLDRLSAELHNASPLTTGSTLSTPASKSTLDTDAFREEFLHEISRLDELRREGYVDEHDKFPSPAQLALTPTVSMLTRESTRLSRQIELRIQSGVDQANDPQLIDMKKQLARVTEELSLLMPGERRSGR